MYRSCISMLLGLCLSLPAWAEPSPTLGLPAAIDQALRNSPAFASARAALLAADGTVRQAGALENPELGVEAENLAGSGDYRGTRAAEYTYSLSQKVEMGGKRASRLHVARAGRQTVATDAEAVRLDVIKDVTTAYGAVLAEQAKLELAEARVGLAKDVLANVSQRVGAARDPLIYKSQADVSLATAELEQRNVQRALQLAKRKLAATWGGNLLDVELDGAVLVSATAPELLEVYVARLAMAPELKRLEDVRASKQAMLRLEKTQGIPDPSFSIGLRDFKETGHRAMVAGVSVPIPVFNRNQGGIARAVNEIVQTEQDAVKARLAAEQALHEAWLDWQGAHGEARDLQVRIIPAAEEALRLSRAGYARGRFSFLEVLNAQRTLADAQEQRIDALHRQLNAKAAVERLTTPLTTPTGD